MNKLITCIILTAVLGSCGVSSTWVSKQNKNWEKNVVSEDEELVHSVYLIGDAGNPDLDEQEPSLQMLEYKLKNDSSSMPGFSQKNKTVVFLGDNIYDYGLPAEDALSYENAKARLIEQLDVVKDFEGVKVMIPGNHDWDKMKSDGWEYVVRQQQFVDQYLNDSLAFLPKGGCPGPVEVKLNDRLTMIVIDSEWWLFPHTKPEGAYSYCDIIDEYDFLLQFRNAIRRNSDKNILVVMHHPPMTNGNHGGHFSLLDHIFPLTLVKDNLYIPLPVVGSIYPLMRKYGISPEDIPSPQYQRLRNGIMAILKDEKKTVVASGHDHNLQLHKEDETNYIVSGSGTKREFLVDGNDAEFLAKENGIAVLRYYKQGEVWVEFWTPDAENPDGKLLFKKPLYAIDPAENQVVSEREIPDYTDSTITMSIEEEYGQHSLFYRIFMGDNYRAAWSAPVKLDYLDMKNDYEGLTPIKLGGGKQTTSLRCMGGDGNQYNIRSVDKDPSSVLPEGFRNTFARDILQDQISTSHPFGALVVPGLAEAVDVYHTKPRILYVPFTPSLGEFIDDIGGRISLVEIRPDENLSEFRNFGHSKNVVGTDKMLEKMRDDNDNSIAAEDFLRARLLDILIGDWDRHEDQWRWAEFDKADKGVIFRPVPRDRDQVFVKLDGILAKIISSRFYQRMLTDFDEEITDLIGLMQQGVHLDKYILGRLELEDWKQTAQLMQKELTDSVIEAAVQRMPPEIVAIDGEDIVRKLKHRRDDLVKYAEKYYHFLSKEVDVILTDKNEYIHVERLENGDTEVRAYKRTFDKVDGEKVDDNIEQPVYKRLFRYDETKEIRIYTMSGEDSILVTGTSRKAIFTRIIGGDESDYFNNTSKIGRWRRNTVFYDEKTDDKDDQNRIVSKKETHIELDKDPEVVAYNYREFTHNKVTPLLFLQYDIDFGFFLGAGIKYTAYDFRKSPYKAQYIFRANHSLMTEAFNIQASADYPSVFNRKTGLNFMINMDGPDYIRNYFGRGNETTNPGSTIQNYRLGLNYYTFQFGFTRRKTKNIFFKIGPLFDYAQIKSIDDSVFVFSDLPEFQEGKKYIMAGGIVNFDLNYTNRKLAPTRGVEFTSDLSYRRSINTAEYSFAKFRGNVNFYTTPNWGLPITFVARVGGEFNIGKFPFYQSAFLSGVRNLRGYRRDRFAGGSSFYQSLEVRVPFFRITNYLLSGQWGGFAFLDNGKVFDDLSSFQKSWHQGYGGGLWINMYNTFVLSGGIGWSKEGSFVRVNTGFFF